MKDSVKDLYNKHDNTQNTVRIIQEGIESNTLAIKTNFELAKEHNLLIEKRSDMPAKQEKEHNELIEAKLDMLAKREKEACSPPKPIVQPLATEDKGDFNAVYNGAKNRLQLKSFLFSP